MCGITGWVSFERDLTAETATLDAMTETMACRGPDDRGTWTEGPAALGHRRLAIIDLPGGRQPMSVPTPEGPVALVYSGEAYNFTELRRELTDRGHRFTTDSDTEVVLHGYLEWGDAVAERLNGMYAFAVWDGRHDKLVMIRDRMGIKPFYYHPTADGVLFGSEPKAVLANPLARPRVTPDGLRELFVMVKTPGHAVWDGMREVEPGTVVTVDRSGLSTRVYWRLETRPHTDDRDTTIATVRSLLDDIVRRQLVADVPRCTLLSGGLDSSAMTALAARQLAVQGETVRSFAVDFVGQTEHFVADELRGTPDTPFVHDVARLARTDHQDIVLDSDSLADPAVRDRVIRARDLPSGLGDMDASLLLLFRAVREKSTVALSGESADEVFGGYLQFFDEEARRADNFPWLTNMGRHFGEDAGVLRADVAKSLDLEGYVADGYRTRRRRYRPAGRRERLRVPDAADQPSAPDPVRAHAPRPQGPDEHGRRPGGPGAVLRPPAGGVRLQRALGAEVLRRPGEEPAPGGGGGRPARLRVPAGEEPVPVHAGPEVRPRAAGAGQGRARPAFPPRLRPGRPGPGARGRRAHRAGQHPGGPARPGTHPGPRPLAGPLLARAGARLSRPARPGAQPRPTVRSAAAADGCHHVATGSHTGTCRPVPSCPAVKERPQCEVDAATVTVPTRRASGSAGSSMVRRRRRRCRPPRAGGCPRGSPARAARPRPGSRRSRWARGRRRRRGRRGW
ncbi:hypothetical protein GCM10017687_04310 [Streptomyces echinatus]